MGVACLFSKLQQCKKCNKKWGSPCSFLCNLDGYYSKHMTHEVHTRNAHNLKRELSFLEKIISYVKISKQFNEIDFNLT